jgi:hypothetical protein
MTTPTMYLGTHMPSWLSKVDVPLFVSHRRLTGRKTMPAARGPWALDSGGFTEISMYGEWRTTAAQYVAATRRYRDEIGRLEWAAPQDWMCEPIMLRKTGLTVEAHQRRTIESYLRLRDDAPDLPFIPVLQGWELADYRRHADAYASVGVDLAHERVVGVGSVCRRQHSAQIAEIMGTLAADGLKLHGFGVKMLGLASYAPHLASADSLAWSFRGRYEPGCRPNHKTEANCLPFALRWRERALQVAGEATP